MTIIIIPNEPNPNMTGRHYGIAKGLSAAGHDVHTVVWDLPQLQTGWQRVTHLWRSLRAGVRPYEDITLHKFRRLPYFWPVVNGWLFKWQLRKLHAQVGANMVFAMSYTNETPVPAGMPFIYDLADDYAAPAQVFGSIAYKIMFAALGVTRTMRKHCQNAVAVTVVSDVLCGYAKQYSSHVVKLPNGVEADIIGSIKTGSVQRYSLVYVSGFGPWSRPVELMQAVTQLRAEFPNISLTLVGEGSEVPAMRSYIAHHNAESYIQYRGFIHDRRAVFQLMGEHEIGLNISQKNAWRDAAHPMKVIEYSSLGKKVVSTDLTGVQALNFPNVFMFSDTPGGMGLTEALRAALIAKPSQTAYRALAARVLQDYSWRHIITELTSLMDAVIQRPPRRIVHVTPAYPPNLGGLEKVVQVLATTEARLGDNTSVITSDKGNTTAKPLHDAIPVTRLRSFVVANTTIMFGLLGRLLELPRKTTVHLHVTQAFTPEMVWLAAKLKHFTYVAHIHLDVPPSGIAGFLLRVYKPVFLRAVLRSAKYVVVFTGDQQQVMHKQYGIPMERIMVVPNGVERKFYHDQPRQVAKLPRLVFVGRLGYQKNLPLLLNALQGISHNFETRLIGEGSLQADLQAQARQLGLKNLTFVGRADGEALLNEYRNANIFVLSSEREGMPLVLLEAMAMGLPIVATDVSGSRDVVVHGQNGLLVPFGNPEAFRSALLSLRNNAVYQPLQIGARRMAENYSWDKIARVFQSLYDGTPA